MIGILIRLKRFFSSRVLPFPRPLSPWSFSSSKPLHLSLSLHPIADSPSPTPLHPNSNKNKNKNNESQRNPKNPSTVFFSQSWWYKIQHNCRPIAVPRYTWNPEPRPLPCHTSPRHCCAAEYVHTWHRTGTRLKRDPLGSDLVLREVTCVCERRETKNENLEPRTQKNAPSFYFLFFFFFYRGRGYVLGLERGVVTHYSIDFLVTNPINKHGFMVIW